MNNKNQIRKLTTLAMFLSLGIALNQPHIQVGENLKIYFYFIVNMMVASIYDIKSVTIYAIFEDILSYFLFQSAFPFFPGYTLTAVLSCLTYYSFLHKEVNLKNIIISKTIVNLIINVLLGSLWSAMLYSKGYIFYMTNSLFKNISMLPIEITLFYLVYKLTKPVIQKIRSNIS